MSNFPCPDQIKDCPCDVSPFKNLSSEAPDLPVFFSTAFAKFLPPLGYAGGPNPCQVTCESTVSQQAADLCAAVQGFECSTGPVTGPGSGPSLAPTPPPQSPAGGGPHIGLFFNQAQSCGATCPDGSVFTYTVPAGIFVARNQLAADKMANSYACRQAQLHMVCLGSLNVFFGACVNQPYLATIGATGRTLAVAPAADDWELISGALPPGLTFHGGPVTGGVATIDGIPTQIGTFTFTISITTPSGDQMTKQYTVTVGGIPNAGQQPDGKVGTAYSQQLMDVGFVNPVFQVVTGTLPDGLTLSAGGLISGNPTTAQTTTAIVQVAEAFGPGACQAAVTITVASVPVGPCGTTPQNVTDMVWTQTAQTLCSNGNNIVNGVCSAWALQIDTGSCGTAQLLTWTGQLCNPGAAYLVSVTLPWSISGTGGAPFNGDLHLSLNINGANQSDFGDLFDGTPNPLHVQVMLPANQISTVIVSLLLHLLNPNPQMNAVSAGNLTVTPLNHP